MDHGYQPLYIYEHSIEHISDGRISLIPAESELAKRKFFLADAFCDIIGARENFFLFCSLQS